MTDGKMMFRRNFLVSVASLPFFSRLSESEPTCSVCGQPCVGTATSQRAQEWGVDNRLSIICWDSIEENLYIHDPEEYES